MPESEVNEKKLKIREGPFRSYIVTVRESLNGTRKLLALAGYTLLPNDYVGFFKPSIRARREIRPGHTNEILAVVRPNLRKAADGFVYLSAARAILGDSVEYACILPPINEHLLLDWLREDGGRMSKLLDANRFMFWMYNPAEDAIMSFVGRSTDPLFGLSFLMPGFFSRKMLEARARTPRKAATEPPPQIVLPPG